MSRKTQCIPLFSPTPTVCITKYRFNPSIFRSHNCLYELFYAPNLFLLFSYDLFLVGIRFKGGGQREPKEEEGEGVYVFVPSFFLPRKERKKLRRTGREEAILPRIALQEGEEKRQVDRH